MTRDIPRGVPLLQTYDWIWSDPRQQWELRRFVRFADAWTMEDEVHGWVAGVLLVNMPGGVLGAELSRKFGPAGYLLARRILEQREREEAT